MPRFAVLFFLAASLISPQSNTEISLNLADFHVHYQKFFRAYYGCKPEALTVEECNPTLGQVDYREFQAMRRAAIKLFDIHEKE